LDISSPNTAAIVVADAHGLAQRHVRATPYPSLLAVRSVGRVAIVCVAGIARIEAADNYVRLWADRPYLLRQTFARVMARLDPALFLRVHRSHAVNLQRVRELRPRHHGEYLLALVDGTEIVTGRSYRAAVQARFALR
jgi:two-component system LytT family response regulator